MQEGKNFLILIAVALIVFGSSMVYASGYFTGGVQRTTPIARVTTIVVTQTRAPDEPFTGRWKCKNVTNTAISIAQAQNFFDVTIADDYYKATKQGEELLLDNGAVFTLNEQQNLLLVKVDAATSYFCGR
jgi:hypothetical protein